MLKNQHCPANITGHSVIIMFSVSFASHDTIITINLLFFWES